MGPTLSQLAAQVDQLRTQLSRLTVPENGRPPVLRLARVARKHDSDAESASPTVDAVTWGVKFVDVLFPADGDDEVVSPTLVERSQVDITAATSGGLSLSLGDLVACVAAADGTWWILQKLPSEAQSKVNACCGCSPSECDFDVPKTETTAGLCPIQLEVDFGGLQCCNATAGGRHVLTYANGVWVGRKLWCSADGGSTASCGEATYRWDVEGECDNAGTYYASWRCRSFLQPNGTFAVGWYLETPCPDCWESSQTPAGEPGSGQNLGGTNCSNTENLGLLKDVGCTYVGESGGAGTWTFLSADCTCGEQPTPPEEDGTYDGEVRTVACPGDPGEDPVYPCEGDMLPSGTLFLGNNDDFLASEWYPAKPGTKVWHLESQFSPVSAGPTHNVYALFACECEEPLQCRDEDPTPPPISPMNCGDDNYDYQKEWLVISCPDADCIPEGTVIGRWMLFPALGYEQARLELRVAGEVKIRYLLPPNRLFCCGCQNRFDLEVSGCDWPCTGIPQSVCVRPVSTASSLVTCEPYEAAYEFTVANLDNADFPDNTCLHPSSAKRSAGTFVLDLLSNAPRHLPVEDNGCRSNDESCCTWLAPTDVYQMCDASDVNDGPACDDVYDGIVNTWGVGCSIGLAVGWVMQTCTPRQTDYLRWRRNTEKYDCHGVPILRFGAYRALEQEGRERDGPSAIQWYAPGCGNGWWSGTWGDNAFGIPPGTYAECCSDAHTEAGSGTLLEKTGTWGWFLEWRLQEVLADGRLVMRNPDITTEISGGWPRDIILTPVAA